MMNILCMQHQLISDMISQQKDNIFTGPENVNVMERVITT